MALSFSPSTPSMSEMSGSENILHCPHVAMHLIGSSHDPLASGYVYDSVPPGRAVMDRASAPPFRVEPPSPYKRHEVGVHFFFTPSYIARAYTPQPLETSLLPTQP